MSAINTVLTTSQSQVLVEYNFDVDPLRFVPSILSVRLLPRVGQAQVVEAVIRIEHSGFFGDYVDTTMLITVHDEAFEEFNIFGQRRGVESETSRTRNEEF